MKPTTLFGTLVLLSAWSSIGSTEAGAYTVQKADNSIEQRIAAARSNDNWSPLLKQTLNGHPDIAAWGNGRGRGWANVAAADLPTPVTEEASPTANPAQLINHQ